MIGDGAHAVFADPLDALLAASQMQQCARRSGCDRGCCAEGPLRSARGHRRAPRQRFLRQRRQPRRADHERRARRPGAAVAAPSRTSSGERLPDGVVAARPRHVRLRDLARPSASSSCAPGSARHVSGAALARGDAEQPAAAGHVVHRSRRATCADVKRCSEGALVDAVRHGRPRQDAAVAAGRRRCRSTTFPDGVWLVELAAIADRAPACPRPSRRCSASWRMRDDRSSKRWSRYVKDRQLLLILDNCEHLIGACAELAKALLQASTRLKILASSREHLRVAGETTYAVPALALARIGRRRGSGDVAALRRGAPFRRARRRRAAGFRDHRAKHGGDRRHLPTSRRHSARDRTCRRARQCAVASTGSPSASAIVSASSRAAAARRCRDSERCER